MDQLAETKYIIDELDYRLASQDAIHNDDRQLWGTHIYTSLTLCIFRWSDTSQSLHRADSRTATGEIFRPWRVCQHHKDLTLILTPSMHPLKTDGSPFRLTHETHKSLTQAEHFEIYPYRSSVFSRILGPKRPRVIHAWIVASMRRRFRRFRRRQILVKKQGLSEDRSLKILRIQLMDSLRIILPGSRKLKLVCESSTWTRLVLERALVAFSCSFAETGECFWKKRLKGPSSCSDDNATPAGTAIRMGHIEHSNILRGVYGTVGCL